MRSFFNVRKNVINTVIQLSITALKITIHFENNTFSSPHFTAKCNFKKVYQYVIRFGKKVKKKKLCFYMHMNIFARISILFSNYWYFFTLHMVYFF